MGRQQQKNKNLETSKILLIILLVIWTCGIFFLVQLLLATLLRWVLPNNVLSSPLTQSLYSITSDIIAVTIILLVPSYVSKKWKTSRKELGLLGLPTWTDIIITPIGYFAYLALSYFLVALFNGFSWFNAAEKQDVGINFSLLFGSDRIITIISLIIVAPIVEEIIYRGFLYGKLKKLLLVSHEKEERKKGRKAELIAIIISTLVTSLSFAIVHGQWNVGVDVFAMSVILCILREITGSIYPGMLVHIMKNTIAFLLLASMISG